MHHAVCGRDRPDCSELLPVMAEASGYQIHMTKEEGFSMDIYVGNLPYEVTDAELQAHFEAFGKVTSARVVMDLSLIHI